MTGSWLFPLVGFLAGAVPCSYLAARCIAGKDVRTEGSGNVGATNAFRVAGRAAGITAAAGDVLKSLLPVLAARIGGASPRILVATAAAVILGHCYSPFLRFKGGKGVISTVSVVVVIFLPAALSFGLVWLACFFLTGYVSLASILGAAAIPITMVGAGAPPALTRFALALFAFVTWKHRENIRRLIAGTESRMRGK